jgi:hypothetical protein
MLAGCILPILPRRGINGPLRASLKIALVLVLDKKPYEYDDENEDAFPSI